MTADDAGNERARVRPPTRPNADGDSNGDGDVTETTRLLNSAADELHPDTSKDTWVGAEDFEAFPSWRRPSVRLPSHRFPTTHPSPGPLASSSCMHE